MSDQETPSAGASPPVPANPYVGPRAFETGQTLYGRDQEIRELLDLLIAERIVWLYSPSGAGKTSLVQAGLQPQLQAEGFLVLPATRVNHEPSCPQGGHLEIANRYVFSVLLSLEEDRTVEQRVPLAELAGMSLSDYLDRRRQGSDNPDVEIALIFDQFEEILTVDPTDLEAKREFFAQLAATLRDRRNWALFVMREEFLGALEGYTRAIPNRMQTTFRLDLLGPGGARQAIRGPAQEAGLTFTDAAADRLVENLRQVWVQQPDGQKTAQQGPHVEPVQLQVVCSRVCESLKPGDTEIGEDDITEVGDVDGALAGYYAERVATVAAQTGVAEGAIRRWCGERLITPQLTRGQVLQGPDDSEGLPNNAVNGLVDAYLVRAERRRGSNWFELAHDRLIEPVRRDNSAWFEEHLSPLQRQAALWEQQSRASVLLLRDDALVLVERWAAEHSGEMTATEQEFLRACQEAQAQLRRERRQARLIRWATYALAVLTIVAVGAAVWAMSAGRSARAQHLAAASSEAGLRDQQLSLLLAVEATRVANEPATEQALRQAVGNVPAYHLTGHRGRVCTTRFSPDSRWLVTGDMGGLVQVRDLGRPLEAGPAWGFQWHGPISAVAINAAGDCLLVGTEGGGVTSAILNRSTMAVSPVAPQGGPPSDASVLACSLDGKWLVTRGRDGTTAEVWNLRAEAATAPIVLRGHRRRVVAAAITPDGRWVATGSEDLTARCWDLRAADPSTTALVSDSHSTAVTSLAITPDGRRLVAGSGDVRTYRVPQRQAKRRELYQDAFLTAAGELGQTVAVSPDGNTVAAGNGDGTTRLWDVRDMGLDLRPVIQFGQCHPQVLSGRGTRSCASALSPNGEWLVRAGYDGTVRRWHLRATYVVPSVHFLLSASQVPIQALAITSDGRWLVVGDDGSTVRRWDLGKRGSQPNPLELKVSECGTQAVAISEDGGQILSGGDDGIVWWHRMGPGAAAPRRVKLEGHHGGIKAIAIAGDGRWAITGSNDNTARAWDLTETQPQSPLPLSEEQCGITAVAVRDDGRMVLTGDVIGRARALDNPGHVGKMPRRVTDHTGSVTAAAVAADGRLVATGGADGTVLLCRTDLGRRWLSEGAADPSQARVLLNTHTGSIVALAFGDNDRYLVSHATDGTTLLWPLQAESKPDAWREAATHQTELLGCEPPVCATAISPDGKWLVTGNEEGETQLWLLPFEALLDHAEQRAVRSLSPWECWQFLPNRVTEPTFPGKPVPCSNSPWLNAR